MLCLLLVFQRKRKVNNMAKKPNPFMKMMADKKMKAEGKKPMAKKAAKKGKK